MTNYRTAFWIAISVCLLLAAALAFSWWRFVRPRAPVSHRASNAEAASTRPPAGAPNNESTATEPRAEAASAEPRLVPIQLSPQRLQSIGVKTGVVERKEVHNEIRAEGDVAADEQLESYVQLRFAGWIQKVFVNTTYQHVHQGEPLFTIYSPDLVTTEQEYLLAKQNHNLLAQSSIPGVASGAASLLDGALARLKQWNVPGREIAHLESSGQVSRELEVDSPVSGYVTERNALPQMYAQPQTRLYTVTGLSTVWVYAAIFQNDIGQIRLGDPATVTVDAYPGRDFYGRVDYIYPQVDPTTRTARVRLVFANPDLKLTPGMFVNVTLDIPLGRRLVIPGSGVFHAGTQNIAFVDHGGGYLEPRPVELGPQAGDETIVLKGLKAGERIVTSANFLIDSESQLQAAIGAFMPPPPGAGAAAAMNRAQANIQFTTNPSLPRKGSNLIQVQLTDNSGEPITGAEVSATFFMPAMPAMGMSAMHTAVTCRDQGGGRYAGTAELQTGGAWQVSVVAQKGGQTIAAKQLTLNATGGM